MNGATFTIPGPILDMLAKGLRDMGEEAPRWMIAHGKSGVNMVRMTTESGPIAIFRAPEMERT